jgi:DNA-binding response OmpR family regulator
MKTKIMIIEDDPNIRFGLEEVLTAEGYAVVTCERGDEAIASVVKERPAMILLDIMLPGMSGYEICKELRIRRIPVLILMLTAKGQEIEKVVGLDLGADDYLTKPFGVQELIARIRALIRRVKPIQLDAESFTIGQSIVDPKTLTLTRGEVRERLTPRELQLLRIFRGGTGSGSFARKIVKRNLGLRVLRNDSDVGPGNRSTPQEAGRIRRTQIAIDGARRWISVCGAVRAE